MPTSAKTPDQRSDRYLGTSPQVASTSTYSSTANTASSRVRCFSAGNGPTEAIDGRLEHLRGSDLGFRNLTNYIARSLLETGGI